uniref:DNA-directed DNA polymerase n=1 Tax=Babjeviella inositovora TaxID=45609 RepID=Q7Z8R7_9ASCO|nr:DNA-polymerase [Babjeviella inositovora]
MEYNINYGQAISDITAELGEEVFNSFPQIAKDALIEKERQILHNKWKNKNIEEINERTKKSKIMAKEMASLKVSDRIGYGEPLGRMIRHKSISLGLEESCEFSNVEASPVLHAGARLFGFRKETILGIHNVLLVYLKKVRVLVIYLEHHSYMYFKIITNGRRSASTRSVGLDKHTYEEDVKILFEQFDKLILNINKVAHGYEHIFMDTSNNYTTFHISALYFPKPRSVLQWGQNIPEIINCGVFDIFTANSIQTDCIAQCSNYIWKGIMLKSIDDIINKANGNVCIVYPQSYINHVKEIKSYSDIRIHSNLPIKSLAVIDQAIVYLIQYREHLGVLHNMRTQSRNTRTTTFKPLSKFSKATKVTVCFDIECYFDPANETGRIHIPYLCCASFIYNDIIGNILEFTGRDCIAQMIEHIVDICTDLKIKNIELVAHNGGAYDFHYILSSMYDPSVIQNILMRNNNFISFSFKHEGINFNVKDSYSFLLCSLSNAAKAFLTDDTDFSKSDFPHHDVRTAEDLQKTYQKWKSIETIINADIEKDKMLITSEHIINYDEKEESRKLIDWAKEYCCNDVLVLAKVWIEFKSAVFSIFNTNIVDQTYTLAGMSFKLFECNLEPGIKLYHPIKEDYMNMRDSLIGVVYSMNGIYEDILCLDVKSLYPAAMAFYDQPYGNYRRVKERIKEELGVYYVKVYTDENRSNSGFFPIRHNNKITYNFHGKVAYYAWYTSVDIDIGLSEGHKIKYIAFDEEGIVGYSWIQKGKIFQKYIEDVLYKLKLQYENERNKVKRKVIKIIMNSLWGKFAQKWQDTAYSIKSESDVDYNQEEPYKIWDTDYMLIKSHMEAAYSSKPIQNGVFTLSWARHHMKLIWDSCASPNAEQLYSDTDSIFVRKDDFDLNGSFELNGKLVPVIGSDVGQLELECTFNRLLCVGKKQYMGHYISYDDDGEPIIKYKKRFKGVPSAYIHPDLYTHLLENPSNTAKISFLKFKREWGSIKGYIEHKNVKAT